jgi:hypothetical protein
MATIPETAPARNPVAYYAHLADVAGLALRDSQGTVHFQADATGLWQELTNADIPRLTLYGRGDLALAADIADGDRVVRCSKTLQARRAA